MFNESTFREILFPSSGNVFHHPDLQIFFRYARRNHFCCPFMGEVPLETQPQ